MLFYKNIVIETLENTSSRSVAHKNKFNITSAFFGVFKKAKI